MPRRSRMGWMKVPFMPSKKRRKKSVAESTGISEHMVQARFITWVRETSEMLPDFDEAKWALRWTHAVPNGFYRSPAARKKAQREGVTAGIHDVFIPHRALGETGEPAFYIEFKRPGSKSRTTTEQKEYADYLESIGWRHEVHDNWKDAARSVIEYLGLSVSADLTD